MSRPEIWQDDVLDRARESDFLIRVLTTPSKRLGRNSLVLNIDAGWGLGKSFFLDRLGQELTANGHIVAHVDAWSSDHADDPLLSVMAAIEDSLRPYLGKASIKDRLRQLKANAGDIVWATTKGVGKSLLNRFASGAMDSIADAMDGSSAASKADESVIDGIEAAIGQIEAVSDRLAQTALDQFRKTEKSIATFKANLRLVLEATADQNVPSPFFVFVDELDRCRPPYAIAMLERVKHLFDINGVAFVIATDTGQLRHSIRAVYGQDFDSSRYLQRFFDRTYQFQTPDLVQFASFLHKTSPITEDRFPSGYHPILRLISATFSNYDLTLRDAAQCYDLLSTITSMWRSPVKLHLAALLPLVIAYQKGLKPEFGENIVRSLDDIAVGPDPTVLRLGGKDIGLLNVFSAFGALSALPLNELSDQDVSTNRTHGWVRSQLLEEITEMFAASGNANPVSLVRQYPGMVQMAGRLVRPLPSKAGDPDNGD